MKKFISLLSILAVNAAYLWLVLGPVGKSFQPIWARVPLFIVFTIASAALLKFGWGYRNWFWAVCTAALVDATIYQIIAGVNVGLLRYVSTYPLSLGWSEGSRYYYASLFSSQSLYGISVPPSILHPSRYLMQAVPFLISGAPLWLHRLWQVILFDVTALATGLLLAWRLRRLDGTFQPGFLFVLYAFLFLFQGPVYYHLLVMVILILWMVKPKRPWLTMIAVLVASAWAGISRVNWLPMPGLLAASIYILEKPFPISENATNIKRTFRYFLLPAIWVFAGTLTGFLTQTIYKYGSGNPIAYFDSSFTSALLWYRLFPNVTYSLGIIANALWVSIPVLFIIGWRTWKNWRQVSLWRTSGLSAILGVLFFGGLVVSVKIGGGSNLHNLDAYLVMLLVVGAYLYYQRYALDSSDSLVMSNLPIERFIVLFAVIVPVLIVVTAGGPLPRLNFDQAKNVIGVMQDQINHADGEILFIRERQLFMFDELQNVTLSPDYEVVFLMEMAMGENPAYLQAFRSDMDRQRYALIITDIPPTNLQGRTHQFGEENDAWVDHVSQPLLCAYEPVVEFPEVNLTAMVPRQEKSCP